MQFFGIVHKLVLVLLYYICVILIPQSVPVAEVVAHPGYTRQTLVDDIALIRLARPANFTLRK